uniref:Uncharacterized protein n=1 Tax=Clytia hemisphaerica TaxID=252671 RepID=A0A7M5X3R0_9CNID
MDMALHSSNNLYCLQKHDKNIKGVKWFGYLHCGIGLTSILLGAVSILILRNAEAAICILFGAWIAITGVDGIFSAKEPTKKILNQRYFAFSLACITMCLVAIGLCIFGFIKYNECQHLQYVLKKRKSVSFCTLF